MRLTSAGLKCCVYVLDPFAHPAPHPFFYRMQGVVYAEGAFI